LVICKSDGTKGREKDKRLSGTGDAKANVASANAWADVPAPAALDTVGGAFRAYGIRLGCTGIA